MKALGIGLFVLATSFATLASSSAQAYCDGTPPLSDAKIRSTFVTFERLLRATPAKQHQAWLRVRSQFENTQALLDYARDYLSTPLSVQLEEEHEYRREWLSGCCD